jgi:PIN domain nuclease of toxin-antitoxin system
MTRKMTATEAKAKILALLDEVAAITWFELAWPVEHERIQLTIPVRSWLQRLAEQVRTVGITPSVAAPAISLPSSFPGNPADRLIYSTAVEHGW